VTFGLDRPATPYEIRTALALFDDIEVITPKETSLEIPSDQGGYIRIPVEEFEFLSLIDDANRLAK
jgi:hypothetical protein